MIDISISSYGTPHKSNPYTASYNRKKRLSQEDYLIFIGSKKHMYYGTGVFNEGFKYNEISKKPAKAVYEI
jgi:hypothetical protein